MFYRQAWVLLLWMKNLTSSSLSFFINKEYNKNNTCLYLIEALQIWSKNIDIHPIKRLSRKRWGRLPTVSSLWFSKHLCINDHIQFSQPPLRVRSQKAGNHTPTSDTPRRWPPELQLNLEVHSNTSSYPCPQNFPKETALSSVPGEEPELGQPYPITGNPTSMNRFV